MGFTSKTLKILKHLSKMSRFLLAILFLAPFALAQEANDAVVTAKETKQGNGDGGVTKKGMEVKFNVTKAYQNVTINIKTLSDKIDGMYRLLGEIGTVIIDQLIFNKAQNKVKLEKLLKEHNLDKVKDLKLDHKGNHLASLDYNLLAKFLFQAHERQRATLEQFYSHVK